MRGISDQWRPLMYTVVFYF